MRQHILLVVLAHVGFINGLLVVGPTYIRSKQDYNFAMANFNRNNKIGLFIQLEGSSKDGRNILNLTKSVEVRPDTNQLESFQLPNLPPGNYKITIDGQEGFDFHQYAELILRDKPISGLIQLDKPIYKPGDNVNFRVIVLDSKLKPPTDLETVNVEIQDPRGNQVGKWSAARLTVGVFEGKLEIAPSPILGIWNIVVKVDGEDLVSKTFELKEYVLSGLNVDIFPSNVPLQEHQRIDLTISATNVFGQPVSGAINLTLTSYKTLLAVEVNREVHGKIKLTMKFKNKLNIYEVKDEVKLNFTFTEQYTNRTISKTVPITIFKSMYRAKLVKASPGFRHGNPFMATIKLEYHDGAPASNIKCHVELGGTVEDELETISDSNGKILLQLTPLSNESITVTVSVGEQELLEEEIYQKTSMDFVKIELKSSVRINHPVNLLIKMAKKTTFFMYYVLAKGNLIDRGYIRPRKKNIHLTLEYSANMSPRAKVLVVTHSDGTVVYDVMDIVFEDQLNNFEVKIEENEVNPGAQIQLDMAGRPESYVALAAYDKSLLQHGSTHDLYWNDVQQIYEYFYGIEQTEHDTFQSFGLFARASDEYRFEEAQSAARHESNYRPAKASVYRTNFAESCLWMNTTMDRLGHLRVIEHVPDSTTAWYLTGFSMHPDFGLGIVRKPLQFKTIKAFYIVEHLPYSIKRGEVATLQFTIFNNLGEDYITKVTLFNVDDQFEFMETTPNLQEFSQILQIPQTVGVPVSFLVKAKKLGELAVRVKAINMVETDAIEKVIRVLPENLVEKRLFSKFFNHQSRLNNSYIFELPVDRRANNGSQMFTFMVNPNLLAPVYKNIGNLLDVPTGCGEQNMIRVVPNILLLDFLTASKSKEKGVIEAAKNNLKLGYQNQLTYRNTDGSFSVFEESEGGVFLTAFVAQWFKNAANHIGDVDDNVVTKAFEWLASTQQNSGRFDEVGEVYDKVIQGGLRDGIALTSFVLIAFLENEDAKIAYSTVVEKSVQYLQERLSSVNDLYDLSIATYALLLNNLSSKDDLIRKLLSKATNDGNYTFWDREPHSIEATSYALLALIQANNSNTDQYVRVMRWLVNERYVTGAFPRTQDTFVGLKALTKMSVVMIPPLRNDYEIQLGYNNQIVNFKDVSRSMEAQSMAQSIPSDVEKLTVHVGGLGNGLLDVTYEYTKDLCNYKNRFDLKLESLNTNSESELQLKVCANYIPKDTDLRSNMALIEVYFPSGYVVDKNPISRASGDSPIKKTEIRFGGTSVVLYYSNMGANQNCFIITAYQRFKVSLRRPAYVLVHDYYNPSLNGIKVYELKDQNGLFNSESNECSRSV